MISIHVAKLARSAERTYWVICKVNPVLKVFVSLFTPLKQGDPMQESPHLSPLLWAYNYMKNIRANVNSTYVTLALYAA